MFHNFFIDTSWDTLSDKKYKIKRSEKYINILRLICESPTRF